MNEHIKPIGDGHDLASERTDLTAVAHVGGERHDAGPTACCGGDLGPRHVRLVRAGGR